ncbi:MAG TPA: hypothetical protein VF222_12180 [Nitrososphaeraceae archaeon]
MASNNNNQNINPRPCVYGCGIQIYWNASVNEYWEVLTKKKHICPNRVNKSVTNTTNSPTSGVSNKPPYSNKKPLSPTPKPKMSNSFEYLQGSIAEIQRKYEILSDLVTEHNGKVQGSQG